jgi:hypothetical protein
LKQDNEIKEDWDGNQYLGITLNWDYKKREVHLSMPGYVKKALAWFEHTPPTQTQNQLHKRIIPTSRATVQYAKNDSTYNKY